LSPQEKKPTTGCGGIYLPSQLWQEAKNRMFTVQVYLGKTQDPVSEITRAIRAGGMLQEVEHLTSKHEALSSNLKTIKKIIHSKFPQEIFSDWRPKYMLPTVVT
jgi:hypothetical protein